MTTEEFRNAVGALTVWLRATHKLELENQALVGNGVRIRFSAGGPRDSIVSAQISFPGVEEFREIAKTKTVDIFECIDFITVDIDKFFPYNSSPNRRIYVGGLVQLACIVSCLSNCGHDILEGKKESIVEFAKHYRRRTLAYNAQFCKPDSSDE